MTRHLLIATLLIAILLPVRTQAAPLPLSPDACPGVDQLSAEDRARVRCGFLRVPEDYAKPQGRTIELAVAIVEPKSGRMVDPVVMLHGGPGVGEMPRYISRLGEPLGPRTLIIFDQRGVGRSRPALCPELSEAFFEASVKGLSADAETSELVLAHNRCHDRLIAEKFDLTKYNTDATVADMEALREALGLARWKVYGISYGTAVGLAYLRDHADRLKAIVLDSVYGLDEPPASNVVVNMMRSLKELAAACGAQAPCKARFGSVEDLFFKALAGVAAEPLDVPALSASVAWADSLKITPQAFLTIVHQLLYERPAYAGLPYLLDRVAARDGEVFALLVDQFHQRAVETTFGQYAAVECYERFPFDSRDDYEQATAAWPQLRDNMTFIVRNFDICANWAVKAPAPMRMPGRSGVPALVLAGGWDPITPPDYSKTAAEKIGARYVELPYYGHGVRGDKACGAPVIRAFLAHPEAALDASCTRQSRPPLFETSAVRVPALARGAFALLSSADVTLAPAATLLLALAAFLLVSAVMWTIVGATRVARTGPRAAAGWHARPGVPLGLSALAIVATLAAAVAALALSRSSEILLLIGLPGADLWLFALPWAALACAAWGLWALVFGAEKAERPRGYAVHLWLVFAASVTAIALLAWLGLLIPDMI